MIIRYSRALLPDADNTYDLGTNGSAFSDIYFDGSVFIDDTEFLHTRDNNIAIGPAALSAVAGGSQNVAVGSNALLANTAGSNNVGIGPRALQNNTTGTNLTAIGNNARTWQSNLNNVIVIGHNALATASNSVRIGNSAVTSIGGYAAWSHLSDGRFKNNIKEDIPGLEFIEKLRPVSYEVDHAKLRGFLKEGEVTETSALQPAKRGYWAL